MKKIFILFLLVLSSCSSFSKGVTQAILEHKEEDTRKCLIISKEIKGIKSYLNDDRYKNIKVMYVHGIGNKQPGNSLNLLYNLSKELGFTTWSKKTKEIKISNQYDEETPTNLRVIKLSSPDYEKDILFYEFVWSNIASKHKDILNFDNSLDVNKQRAEFNAIVKKFINTAGVDPLVYLGEGRTEILDATMQAFCIMIRHDWDEIKSDKEYNCFKNKFIHDLNQDKYILITHSLGSKIVIDGLQYSAKRLSEDTRNKNRSQIKDTEFDIFMLSNQLPLLQVGSERPEVIGGYKDYCIKGGKNYSKRAIGKTEIYAFSDPNDLLSYNVPSNFASQYLDTRICPVISNININIAQIKKPLGIIEIANPFDAHTKYDEDKRVISIIADGYNSPIVQEKCDFIKLE